MTEVETQRLEEQVAFNFQRLPSGNRYTVTSKNYKA